MTGKLLGATLLVSGTAIGAAMLALPIETAEAGFFPSFISLFCTWLLMLATGLLYVEVYLGHAEHVNIIGMVRSSLGKFWVFISYIAYFLLFYSLIVAYVSEGGRLLSFLFPLKAPMQSLLFLSLFFPSILGGAFFVDRLNRFLFVGMILAYFFFIFLSLPSVSWDFLSRREWNAVFFPLPVIATSFGFHGVIPSVMRLLDRDIIQVKKALFFGTLISFVVYLLWEAAMLGTLPFEGPGSLMEARALGETALFSLTALLSSSSLFIWGRFFAFCALASSFLGVSLGLIDFIIDAFHLRRSLCNRVLLCLSIFFPACFFSLRPGIFFFALRYGASPCALFLLVFLPILLAWKQRQKQKSPYKLWGGKTLLKILFLGFSLQLFSLFL